MKHVFRLDGSDTGRREIMAYCPCGWSGKVVDGQGPDSVRVAQQQWDAHVAAAKQAEEKSSTNRPIKNPDAFLQGQRDCQNGIKHVAGKGKDYDRGYAAEYEKEQVMTELSLRRAR